VQSAHFIENDHFNPMERVTFYGMEKNPTTIRLAKMNLAVHGLEGAISKAISYYDDPHELVGKCDFVMANPPFNVDEVDAEKVKNDLRVQYGLPGINKKGKLSNGNYLWINYFDAYLNKTGRAGFVMSSQASSAGNDEKTVRENLIASDHVAIMMAIRGNFFYTRTVPCELWFLDKSKPTRHKGKVLMIDARSVFRKVTRKIYDFSPEQQRNLTAIVWLYRGQQERFLELLEEHLEHALEEAQRCVGTLAIDETIHDTLSPLAPLVDDFKATIDARVIAKDEVANEIHNAFTAFEVDVDAFGKLTAQLETAWKDTKRNMKSLTAFTTEAEALANSSRDLIKSADHLLKLIGRTIEVGKTNGRGNPLKDLDAVRKVTVEQLKLPRYFWKQAHWLTHHFPDAKLRDVPGLVRLVDQDKLKANDWSLTPGRYVGVTPQEDAEDFDFEETLRNIHLELQGLNDEAVELAEKITENFGGLGI